MGERPDILSDDWMASAGSILEEAKKMMWKKSGVMEATVELWWRSEKWAQSEGEEAVGDVRLEDDAVGERGAR